MERLWMQEFNLCKHQACRKQVLAFGYRKNPVVVVRVIRIAQDGIFHPQEA
jgi:hypothetical protein